MVEKKAFFYKFIFILAKETKKIIIVLTKKNTFFVIFGFFG